MLEQVAIFFFKIGFQVHIQKHHKKLHVKPLDDKPFACSECGLGFRYERSKIKHEFKAHLKQEATSLWQTMDRYIVHSNDSGQNADQVIILSNNKVGIVKIMITLQNEIFRFRLLIKTKRLPPFQLQITASQMKLSQRL